MPASHLTHKQSLGDQEFTERSHFHLDARTGEKPSLSNVQRRTRRPGYRPSGSAVWIPLGAACVRRCLFMWLDWAKQRPQTSQRKGFSPVWVRSWFFSWWLWEKRLAQCRQEKGFSPVWTRSCLRRDGNLVKDFPQTSQRNSGSPPGPRGRGARLGKEEEEEEGRRRC